MGGLKFWKQLLNEVSGLREIFTGVNHFQAGDGGGPQWKWSTARDTHALAQTARRPWRRASGIIEGRAVSDGKACAVWPAGPFGSMTRPMRVFEQVAAFHEVARHARASVAAC